jgi:hypothetical protein
MIEDSSFLLHVCPIFVFPSSSSGSHKIFGFIVLIHCFDLAAAAAAAVAPLPPPPPPPRCLP